VVGTDGHPALSLVNLSKTFPGTRALVGLSLELERGEIHALVGQNGSGKSTLIKILAGYHAPDPGSEVWVGGTEITTEGAAAAHRLGLRFVHQGLGLIDELNAVDSFGMVSGFVRGPLRNIDWAEQARRVEQQLARFNITLDVMRPVGELDAVERTAVAVTRALEGLEPGRGAVVLDEPTVALTNREVGRLVEVLRDVARTGVSVLYVSHYLEEVFAMADRVSVLKGGRLVTTRPTSELDRDELVRLMVGRDVAPTVRGRRRAGDRPDDAPALRVRNLAGKVLEGIDFDVARGEVLGIAGLQGSGMGECPYALIGSSAHPGSTIEVDGVAARRRTPRSMAELGVRLVPRDRNAEGAIREFNVRENMTLGRLESFRRAGRVRPRDERRFVRGWISDLDLAPPDPEHGYETLSGGNQQKVVLAKWLGVDPKVLVLDEPTNGVDIGAREKIYRTIRDQAAAGLTFVVCSSDPGELAEIADRVLVLSRGRIDREIVGEEITEVEIVHALHAGEPRGRS
jgi:ribose transport system ATP-binding protein